MNEITKNFVGKLKCDSNVSGVILFGSWARGNNRPDSDVDLVVILKNGYQRAFENIAGQNFEIIYTTSASALEYWKTHPDDAANLWEVARIIFDRDAEISNLKEAALEFLAGVKKLLDKDSRAQLEFSAKDTLIAVGSLRETDTATAVLVLENTVLTLTEQYFDLRQLWTPAPKQRIGKIKEIEPYFYDLLNEYYKESVSLDRKIELTNETIRLVFS